MEAAKVIRNQRSSVLSRYINKLSRKLKEENLDHVKTCLQSMEVTFDELEQAHYDYYDYLGGSKDVSDEALQKSTAWFEAITKEYLEKVTEAHTWLKEQGVSALSVNTEVDAIATATTSGASQGEALSSELAALLGLPKVEIPLFSGDPRDYTNFISTFDQVIGDVISSDKDKLIRLLQYLSGDALAAVESYALIGGSAGYAKVRSELKSRFGSTHLISRRIIDDLKKGKAATKPHDLRCLADDLNKAYQTLTKLGALGEVNTQQFICDILMRCHPQVRSTWRKLALKDLETKNVYPQFQQFVTFMGKAARQACDPVYGFDNFNMSAKAVKVNFVSSTSGKNGAAGSNLSVPSLSENKCPVCCETHDVVRCTQFKSLRPEQRLQVARKKRLCFRCLSSSHMMANCPKSGTCEIDGCTMRHCKWLHVNHVQSPSGQTSDSGNEGTSQVTNHVFLTRGTAVYLPMITVLVNGREPALALLDSGSTNTLMTKKFADKLGLEGKSVTCNLSTVNSQCAVKTKLVSFDVSSLDNDERFPVRNACVVSDIPAEVPTERITLAEYPHLADLPLGPCKKGAKADLLIGLDNPDLLAPLQVRRSVSKAGQPYATQTKLGWVMQGPVGDSVTSQVFVTTNHVRLEQLDEQIQNLWNVEHEDETVTSWSVEDRQVHDMWQEKTQLSDGRYTVPIPWRPGRPCFPNNRYMAEKRLKSTVKRLHKTSMYQAYDDNVQKLLSDGHAEPVPLDLLSRDDGKVWYLPHFAVLSESKPGKVRIVHDCAAQYGGVSLNSECLQGPDLCTKLLHVLLRFRQYEYAVTADIQSMYLQVRIPEDDRDCLRFLWHEDGKVVEYRMTSHLFGGVWCASSSTYALRCTLEDFRASCIVDDAVRRSMYVDDMLRSLPSIAEVNQLIAEVRSTLSKGGFNLTKFMVNDVTMLEQIPEENRAQEAKVITPELHSKALGIRWDVGQDQFSYVRKATELPSVVTKRNMLSIVASMYDPLGLIIPVVIQGRMLFQQATELALAWDDPVPYELLRRWMCWWDALENLGDIRFDRCVVPKGFSDGAMELHHFCDGSQQAYGACSYLRILNKAGSIHVQLLTAKARLTPLKPMTIPRVELCAAVTAVRLDEVLRRELDLELLQSTFWSDSQVVLSYISSEAHRFRVFVANRVAYVRSCTSAEQWRYIPSQENPADVLSRGCVPTVIPENWKSGPDFLSLHRDSWSDKVVSEKIGAEDPEVKKLVCSGTVSTNQMVHPLDVLLQYYSEYPRLKKAVAWLRRWIKLMMRKKGVESGGLTVQDLREAEDVLIGRAQAIEYEAELCCLQEGKPVKKTSHIASLDPKVIRGKIVVGGRIKHAPISYTERHQVILPPRHRLSKLLLLDAHNRAHLGTEWVLSCVRKKYWIPGARNTLRQIRKLCVKCQRLYGKPRMQKMADLPEERCTPGPVAFRHVGVDLFGPFHVIQGRSTVKRYGCVFTCFTVRAIHLEVLHSLETDAFINGLRRFCARRGQPSTVRSDRGTNLVGASIELAEEMKHLNKDKIINTARSMDIEWTFNPPMASHQGGVWERMIRTVRKVLMAVIPLTSLTDEVLSTVFCEVEAIVNGRPLTKCSADILDETPLTPNHFLLLEGNYPVVWRPFHGGEVLRKRWKRVQNIVASFWKRWLRQYLPELQKRQKWIEEFPDYKIGDLVLVVEEQAPRGQWPLALVQDIHVGRDQKVRSMRLKVRGTELVRPITKVVPLEMF